MNRKIRNAATACLVSLAAAAGAATIQMPPGCTTPDGMVIDPQGRLVIAAPNTKHDQPGAFYRIEKPGAEPVKWFEVPALKESGYSQPMGVCFGEKDEMFVCDCQKAGLGRILRVKIENDRPVSFAPGRAALSTSCADASLSCLNMPMARRCEDSRATTICG